MDSLLSQHIEELPDERTALFGLIDRFSERIYSFQKDYADLKSLASSDINSRKKDKEKSLAKIDDEYESNRKKLEFDHENQLGIIDSTNAHNTAETKRKIEEEDRKCQEQINKAKNRLDSANRSEDARIQSYSEIIKDLNWQIDRVDKILGKAKLEKIIKALKLDLAPINDVNNAKDYLSDSAIRNAEELVRRIQIITESLPRRIFRNNRRTAYIKQLLEIRENAKNALKYIRNSIQKKQNKRQEDFINTQGLVTSTCNRNKQNIIAKQNELTKEYKEQIVKENHKYKKNSAKLDADHEAKRIQEEKHHDQQISNAIKNWKEKIRLLNFEFEKQIEEKFPAQEMNTWINKFWYHPRRLDQYKIVCNKVNRNLLLGEAQIDISDWLSGETSNVVRKVLLKYPTLFGFSKEQRKLSYINSVILLPYSISIENGDSLLLLYEDNDFERAKGILNEIALRLLNSVPACLMRFILLNAGGYGMFGPIKQIDPSNKNNPSESVVKSIILGEGKNQNEMHRLVDELSTSFSEIEGNMSKYSSISEFNEHNPLSKLIYKPMLMGNYPCGLCDDDIKTITKIITDCSKWGSSFFFAEPDTLPEPLKPETVQLKKKLDSKLINLRLIKKRNCLAPVNAKSTIERKAFIKFFEPSDNQIIDKEIAPDLRKRSVEASRIFIDLFDTKDIYVESKKRYKEKASDGIVVPVGYLESGDVFNLQFDDKLYVHGMIMGQTGSGKSNFLHALIMGILLRYDPSEVKIYLIDFKKGLDFNVYTKYYLPSFAAIGINSNPEFALAMLSNLEKEFAEREKVIDANAAKNISDANKKSVSDKLCRIIFIIDELYVLSEIAEDGVRKAILEKINILTHQGRAVGIHVVVCGQDLNKINYFAEIKNQCYTRIAFRCEDNQVRELLSDNAVKIMHSIDENDQGSCVFSVKNGLEPHKERTVYVDDDRQRVVLNEISNYYLSQHRTEVTKILHSNIIDNPNHPLQLFVSHGIVPDLGMNIEVGNPLSMERSLSIRPTGNLLIAGGYGSDDSIKAANSVMFFSVYSILLNKLKYKNIEIYCSNCADQQPRSIDDDENDVFGHLSSSLTTMFHYDKGEEVFKTLDIIKSEIDKRSESNDCKEELWWFISRPEKVERFCNDSYKVAALKEILSDGPKFNVHVVLWNNEVKKCHHIYDEISLFRDRICLEMEADDLKSVNGTGVNPVPKGYMASAIGDSTMMRFRVFDFPGFNGLWMNSLLDRLKNLNG